MDLHRTSPALTKEQKLAVVSLDEVKVQARVRHSSEDSMIEDDIEAAYDLLSGPDGWLNGACLLNETWEWYPTGPANNRAFILPLRPVLPASTATIEFLGDDGAYAPMDAALYSILHGSGEARFERSPYSIWPGLGVRRHRPFRIRFTAGFGTTKDEIPSPLRKAIKLLAAHWFKNREATGEPGRATGDNIKYGVLATAGRYRFALDHS